MDRLTKEEVDAALEPYYVPTLYGREIGLRRLVSGAIVRVQALFAEPKANPDGTWKDPLGVDFLDVECPGCGADLRARCEQFADEPVPHEGRVETAKAVRRARGNHHIVRSSIVDPPLSAQSEAYLESQPAALVDLINKILEFNNLTPASRGEVKATFREGVPGAGEVPGGS